MKKILSIFAVAVLSLFAGEAFAQRNLPGMSTIEVRADMVNGFYTVNSRNCGYNLGVFYSIIKGNNANTWSFGGEYLQTYKPYGEKGRIPVAQFTGEAGYNLRIVSDYSQTFHLYGGISALAGYETVNWGESVLRDGSTIQARDAFIYGGAVTLSADFYLSDHVALGTHLKEKFVFGNDTGHFLFAYGIHLKYQFQPMRYTKNDISRIPLTEFMAALGEKPVNAFEDMKLYYAPQRDDPEPMLVVDTNTNRWYDHATDQSGDIIDLAALKMNPNLYTDLRDFIVKYMNDYEHGKELSAMARQPLEPKVVTPDIRKIRLTDFMKALGQEHPVAADGNLRIYKAPYDPKGEPTMVINIETNLWRDTKSGAYGGIYDLAYEMTGSANMRELNMYIAGEMSNKQKVSIRQMPKEPPKHEPDKPKRKMRL